MQALQFAREFVTATVAASAAKVQAGQRMSLALDLALDPSIHIHASREGSHALLEWDLIDSGAFLNYPPDYPPAQAEVSCDRGVGRAFAHHVRIQREITIGPDAQVMPVLELPGGRRFRCSACGGSAGVLHIDGVLRFQACGNKAGLPRGGASPKTDLVVSALRRRACSPQIAKGCRALIRKACNVANI